MVYQDRPPQPPYHTKGGRWLLLAIAIAVIITPMASADYYTSKYPPDTSATYINTTSFLAGGNYNPWFTTDPAKLLVGSWNKNQWISNSASTNQRFQINLGNPYIISRIYYENTHSSGTQTTNGGRNFTFWGSNSYNAFRNTTYTNDTGWTQLTTNVTAFTQHVASNISDPHYVSVTNDVAYQYYAFKISSNYAGTYIGLRRVELQVFTDTTPPYSITGLTNTTETTCNAITWTWTNPIDTDFNYTQVYQNGTFLHNVANSSSSDAWTNLPGNTAMTISTQTCDLSNNCNATWVNTTYTLPACVSPPIVSFTQNVTIGNVSQAVQFTETSLNSPTSWNWSFGDGNLSADQNPLFIFMVIGNWSVRLNATNSAGSNMTADFTHWVNISAAPTPIPTPTTPSVYNPKSPPEDATPWALWGTVAGIVGYVAIVGRKKPRLYL